MAGDPSQGRITSGLARGTTVWKTLQFVKSQLPRWRDMPGRPLVSGEEELNGQLCKYLNVAARRENFAMAYFHHEERQTGKRRVDLSALPPDPAVIEGRGYTELDPFLVLEGKRLPAPRRDREREYVTGGDKKTGGIQRFKLGLHGAMLRHAGMIGYVQRDSFDDWFASINVWITDLAESTSEWSQDDCLAELTTDSANRVASCVSVHDRVEAETGKVHLSHLWVDCSRPHCGEENSKQPNDAACANASNSHRSNRPKTVRRQVS